MPNYKNLWNNDFWNGVFSHIYVEQGAYEYPFTQKILMRLENRQLVAIDHYKDVFNRVGQNFLLQKNSPKLILAVRRNHFLFEGADVCDHYGYERFFYASQMMNCLYNCEYCYLRGMYQSANVVMFVNTEDYFSALQSELKNNNAIYCSISYDTDLLAFESMTGYLSEWVNFAKEHGGSLILESRTKSANFNSIAHLTPVKNVILAWTVSPDEIINRYQKGTPSLGSRIKNIQAAVKAGWLVRLCVDPVLRVEGWEALYQDMIKVIKQHIDVSKLVDFNMGGFRISKTLFNRMRKLQPDSFIFTLPLVEKDKVMQYRST